MCKAQSKDSNLADEEVGGKKGKKEKKEKKDC